MKFALVVLCLFALWRVTSCQVARVYCGRRLARTLATLCQDMGEDVMKRSGGAVSPYSEQSWRWSALGGVRGKRGVVDECCDKPCTLDELLTFC